VLPVEQEAALVLNPPDPEEGPLTAKVEIFF